MDFWRGRRRRQAAASSPGEAPKAVESFHYKAFAIWCPKNHAFPMKSFDASGYREAATPYFLVKVRQSTLLKKSIRHHYQRFLG